MLAINRRLWEHYADGFGVRLKRLYELELTRRGAPPERRRVLAKSVGWGWLGYHAYIIGRRLAGSVPPVIGLRNGLVLTESLDEADGDRLVTADRPMTHALASYVARRARQLPVGEDPCFDRMNRFHAALAQPVAEQEMEALIGLCGIA